MPNRPPPVAYRAWGTGNSGLLFGISCAERPDCGGERPILSGIGAQVGAAEDVPEPFA